MELLTRKEVARVLRITTRGLDKWRQEGKAPPFIDVNGAPRCRKSDLAEWLDSRDIDGAERVLEEMEQDDE